jgi:hypothetical protein
MLQALEQIRRMRGGAQSHLMRCSDGYYYVVKFQNNPQHRRILVNEMLGTKLAARLGLPTVPVAIVEVSEELIRLTPELAMELPRTRIACQPGLQFGARYPGDPRQVTLHDFLPDEQLREVENLHEFAGMLVFDKWTCNTNGRQTVFFDERKVERDEATVRYKTRMIDQGFCFNAGEWNFPDAPLRGLYARHRVYESVRGLAAFGAWMNRVENITESVLEEIYSEIPPEWYAFEPEAIERMLGQLLRRRKLVGELIVSAWKSSAQPFPHWK